MCLRYIYYEFTMIQFSFKKTILADRETERQRDRETERQRDKETERQRDRETERQRCRATYVETDKNKEGHKF